MSIDRVQYSPLMVTSIDIYFAMGQNPGTRLFTPDIVIIVGKSLFIFSKYRISHSFWSTSHIAMSQNTSTLGTLK